MVKEEIRIPVGDVSLEGTLSVPENAVGMVIFSHGSGSSRFSPRNNMVAEVLHRRRMATLLFDLLTYDEDEIYENRFNIPLLTQRLVEVAKWVRSYGPVSRLKIGFFGASTGAASALNAAAILGKTVGAVVSRGGRPDLAMENLTNVRSPVLLIVGGLDDIVIELNQRAYDQLTCEKEMKIVPEATHLFSETGTLESVASMSADWFEHHLA